MKFNLEKNNLINKTVLGAEIIASTLGNVPTEELKYNQNENSLRKNEITTQGKSQQEKFLYAEKINNERAKTAYDIDKIRRELGLSIENNKDEKLDPEFYRNEYIEYMKHPSYKLRLAKEMYGDTIIDDEKQKNINREYEVRLKIIKDVPVAMILDTDSPYKDTSHAQVNKDGDISIETSPRAAPHELAQVLDPDYQPSFSGKTRTDEGFDNKKNEYINLDKNSNDLNQIENEKFMTLRNLDTKKNDENHEKFLNIVRKYIADNKNTMDFTIISLSNSNREQKLNFINNQLNDINGPYFTLQEFYKYFDSKDVNKISSENKQLIKDLESFETNENEIKGRYDRIIDKLRNIKEYFGTNPEIKARLNYLRIKAMKEYGYNLNDVFDINKFEKLKKDFQYEDLKNELKLNDNQINELMKYTASNEYDVGKKSDYYHPGWNYNDLNNQA